MIFRLRVVSVLAALLAVGLLAAPNPGLAVEVAIGEKATEKDAFLFSRLFHDATEFSVKMGPLPHYRAYKTDAATGAKTLLGFLFKTHEVEPDEWAYAGPIETLVGLTTAGTITEIRILYHREPFGSFSIDPPEFRTQFEGKSILAPFEIGEDVDAVSRATFTVDGAARAIKKGSRKIMQQYLAEQKKAKK
ncbi:MAG: FMN-binding protein [Rhodospirillaceae bacterium]|nr:FMN-binding protein [Rhodospirillaceae bacterium]